MIKITKRTKGDVIAAKIKIWSLVRTPYPDALLAIIVFIILGLAITMGEYLSAIHMEGEDRR